MRERTAIDVQLFPSQDELDAAKGRLTDAGTPIVRVGDFAILGVRIDPYVLAETLERVALELRTAAGEWEQDRSEAELAAVS